MRIAVGLGVNKLRVTGGEPLVRRDLPVLIAQPGRHSRHSGPGADHQRRAAGRTGRSRCTMPGCGASTSTSTRSIASASSQITRRDDLDRVLRGLETAPSGSASADQAQRRGGEESGGAGHRAAGALRARERLRGALHRVHAARRAEPVGSQQGAAGRRHDRDAVARDLAARRRFPIRDPRAPATEYALSRMAAARSASSPRSAGRSA